MTIQAIETRYAGCRFRSRLEARWAVFFDDLDITWEYEAQGFTVAHRITGEEGRFSYLPDFWLPELNVFAEVKGSLTREQLLKLLNAAAYLSSPYGGCGGGSDMIVLGPVPRVNYDGAGSLPWRLHMHKGDLLTSAWFVGDPCGGHLLTTDAGDFLQRFTGAEDRIATALLDGNHVTRMSSRLEDALAAARSARFEHGESGGRYISNRAGF